MSAPVLCAKRECSRGVTEWLLVRRGVIYDAIPCCRTHPAAERAAAMRITMPSVACLIVPQPAEVSGHGLPGVTQSARDAFLSRPGGQTAITMWHLGRRALIEAATEIARLKAELDAHLGRPVLHCLERDLTTITAAAGDAEDGTIIRTTDTGRELVLAAGKWERP